MQIMKIYLRKYENVENLTKYKESYEKIIAYIFGMV